MRVVGTDVVLLLHIYTYIYAAAGDAHEQAVPVAVVCLKLKWLPALVPCAACAHHALAHARDAAMKKRVSSEFMCLCRLRFRVGGLALGLSSIGSSYRSNEDSAAASHSRCGQHRQQQPVAE